MELAETLEPLRPILQEACLNAQRRLTNFAKKHCWERHIQKPFARLFRVHADKRSFDTALLETCGLDPTTDLPATYCAALEQEVLMCVSPELYRSLYPEGDEENAFEKLLTHEMAHRLHIRILNGDEDAMGAVWFYEGFAIHAAGQFEKNAPVLNAEELWEIVLDPQRGSYRRYASVFQNFVKKVPIQDLVERAGKDDFVPWLKEISR